jgi:uncharacterized membrane protein
MYQYCVPLVFASQSHYITAIKKPLAAVLFLPGIFLLGLFWMLIIFTCVFSMAFAIRAPLFFIAVGAQANIGGVASAPIVASAFDPALAPVGALLAVLGNFVGTFGGWGCALMMEAAACSVSDCSAAPTPAPLLNAAAPGNWSALAPQ